MFKTLLCFIALFPALSFAQDSDHNYRVSAGISQGQDGHSHLSDGANLGFAWVRHKDSYNLHFELETTFGLRGNGLNVDHYGFNFIGEKGNRVNILFGGGAAYYGSRYDDLFGINAILGASVQATDRFSVYGRYDYFVTLESNDDDSFTAGQVKLGVSFHF